MWIKVSCVGVAWRLYIVEKIAKGKHGKCTSIFVEVGLRVYYMFNLSLHEVFIHLIRYERAQRRAHMHESVLAFQNHVTYIFIQRTFSRSHRTIIDVYIRLCVIF